jgi:hypothetical protein
MHSWIVLVHGLVGLLNKRPSIRVSNRSELRGGGYPPFAQKWWTPYLFVWSLIKWKIIQNSIKRAKIAKNVKSCYKVSKVCPNRLFERFWAFSCLSRPNRLRIYNFILFCTTFSLSQSKNGYPPLEPCGIDFWQSVGIGIIFWSNVGFRSGSGSVSGLKKVVVFSRFFRIFVFFDFFCCSFDGPVTVLSLVRLTWLDRISNLVGFCQRVYDGGHLKVL